MEKKEGKEVPLCDYIILKAKKISTTAMRMLKHGKKKIGGGNS